MTDLPDLGDLMKRLATTIESRRAASPESSYTARLLAAGVPLAAKKLGEESVETVIAAISGTNEEVAYEAGDLIYHLLVVLAARRVPLTMVAAALLAREGQSGLEEKAARKRPPQT